MDLVRIIGFQWDAGNARKSADKHGVTQAEAEQLFLNEPLLIINDAAHSQSETRYHALGRTHDGRLLHATFTLRDEAALVRVISARDMPGICIERSESDMTEKRKSTSVPVLDFKSEAEERAYWETHDSSAHVDWNKAERVRFSNLKPSTKSISIRLPVDLLERIRLAANKRDVPYQSLIKVWLAEKVDGGG
jgi:uncharacterized DUF497 family protein